MVSAEEPSGLDKAYEILLDALGFEPPSINALIQRTGLSTPTKRPKLLCLGFEGRVGWHAGAIRTSQMGSLR